MKKIDESTAKRLVEMACEAREHAYAPYSHFHVGACLLAANGKFYQGCNIENAAYSPTNCAERTALFTAVYEGEREFDAIAIACSGDAPAYPCGVCRQALSEFCDADMPVYVCNLAGEVESCTLGDLLPHSFGRKDLE